ncbi:hypothetical protein QVD17_26678 [Tagetes erecta]|uniref:Uncharacterized protein n=1 Tax=Tagetes erecta TaxID=13708 RepID=A0AAD8K724_TARER|nr:hypothetical protein QVD17_26678 [Tagetes erecta]
MIMGNMNFPQTCRLWIKVTLSLARCHARQGDPLAPFLFILVMEALHVVMMMMMMKAINLGILEGTVKPNNSPTPQGLILLRAGMGQAM